MASSKIEWTETTWNPTTGCNKISTGCLHCYAETMSRRLKAMGIEKYKKGFKIALHPEELKRPFDWKKPSLVFVNSMSDLFHYSVPIDYVQQVFEVMNNTPQHTYQVLTKRSERLEQIAPLLNWTENIWMGVSVESEHVSGRIAHLIKTPAFVKFLSCEPLIAPLETLYLDQIDWVIVGGESGPRARIIKKEWVEEIHRQCEETGTPFFFKQWGKPHFNKNPDDPTLHKNHIHHAKGGCELNGKIYQSLPDKYVSQNA